MSVIPALARRAQPLLGTLVEIGADRADALAAGFEAVARVQACMSRFDEASDIGRFNALPAGETIEVDEWTAQVLHAAQRLHAQSGGRFDASLGSAPEGWRCEGSCLYKIDAACRLDLGGIAKGFAVDRAVDALQAAGAGAGWVNAGGDLRVFGPLDLPVMLRDEQHGGVRELGRLAEGAVATSRLGGDARSALAFGQAAEHHLRPGPALHLSVLAPECLWADALTKVVATYRAEGHTTQPDESDRSMHVVPAAPALAALLDRHGAQAWWH